MSGPERTVSVSRTIAAPPEAIFAVIADASRHADFDGSGTVTGTGGEPQPLALGTRFAMGMRMGLPYKVRNEVVEYEADRLIAWRHIGHHRWRYELAPVDGGTEVTETFDWSTSRAPWILERLDVPEKHRPNMEKTLERLEAVVTGG